MGEGIPLPIGADVVVGGRGGKNGSSTGGNVGSTSVDGTGGGVFANIGLVVPPPGTSEVGGGDNPGGGGISPNRHSVPCIPKLDLIVSVLHVLEKSRRMVYVVGEQLHILLVDVDDDCS